MEKQVTTDQTSEELPQVKRYPAHFYATPREMRDPALRHGMPHRRVTKDSRQLCMYRNPPAVLQVSR